MSPGRHLVNIAFLAQGRVAAVAPETFPSMTQEERLAWADDVLRRLGPDAVADDVVGITEKKAL